MTARKHHGTVAQQLEALERLGLENAERLALAEERADLALRQINFLAAALQAVPEVAEARKLLGQPGSEPEPEVPAQRDFDDAVAELIRRARRDFGSAR